MSASSSSAAVASEPQGEGAKWIDDDDATNTADNDDDDMMKVSPSTCTNCLDRTALKEVSSAQRLDKLVPTVWMRLMKVVAF